MSRHIPRVLVSCILLALAASSLSSCGAASKVTQPQSMNAAQSNEAASQAGMLVYAGSAPSPVPSSLVSGGATTFASRPDTRRTFAPAETTITVGNVSWTLDIQWFDAADAAQAIYDPLTTVRMHADTRGTGSATGPNGTATLGTSGAFDVTGVSALENQLTTNGNQADTLHYTVVGQTGSATVVAVGAGVLSNVVESKPVADHHPASGTDTWVLDVNRHLEGGGGSLDEHYTAVVVVTFNGTHLVPVIVNGTYHYVLDLDTGQVSSTPS